MTADLNELLAAAHAAREVFLAMVPQRFPGATQWDWARACSAMRGENCRRNDDTSRDEALAADPHIRAAHENYITALHRYYKTRDGEHGFLGKYERATP